jgi:hypothetical protein
MVVFLTQVTLQVENKTHYVSASEYIIARNITQVLK